MTFAEFLARRGCDSETARLAGLHPSTLSRIRRGVIDPPLSTVVDILSKTGGQLVIVDTTPGVVNKRRNAKA